MHWRKEAESAWDYKAMVNPEYKYHIGLYHTEFIIPSTKLYDMNMSGTSSANTVIANDGLKIAANHSLSEILSLHKS